MLFSGAAVKKVTSGLDLLGYSIENWNRLKTAFIGALTLLHRRSPDIISNEDRVLLDAGLRLPKEAAAALATELMEQGALVREATGVRLKTHVAQLNPADAVLWKRTEPLLKENVLRPPSLHEIASALGQEPKKTESFLVRVAHLGLLVRVAENRFFLPAGLRSHCQATEKIAATHQGSVTGGKLRDHTGIGRTLAIEVLEYFDRIEFTRRVGDEHYVLRPAREAFGE
jgi:selenocysteine-specific elongation factor